MKYLLIIPLSLLLDSATAQHICKPGYKCFDLTILTSDFKIEAGCYPDSTLNKLLNALERSVCLNGGFASCDSGGKPGSLSHERKTQWSDSCGCKAKESWRVLRGGKWIEISKKEYEEIRAKNDVKSKDRW